MNINQLEKSNLSDDAKKQIRKAYGEVSVKKNKYGNTIVEIDGIKFRSKKEGQRYCDLKMLMRAGDVQDFRCQVPYTCASDGEKEILYYFDFVVLWKDGHISYEDTKGMRTALYKLKKMLMKEKYGIEITEL